MLKSSNLNSVINELLSENEIVEGTAIPSSKRPDTLNINPTTNVKNETITPTGNNNNVNFRQQTPTKTQQVNQDAAFTAGVADLSSQEHSLSTLQLSAGLLQIAEPPLVRARVHVKELIGKQNKIYIDLSREKFKLDCSEVNKLNDMMNDVKLYKEKLNRIKRQMQNIYQRTKVLKKRASNIEACKQREYQRKLEKQQQEESLIGRQQQ